MYGPARRDNFRWSLTQANSFEVLWRQNIGFELNDTERMASSRIHAQLCCKGERRLHAAVAALMDIPLPLEDFKEFTSEAEK
jgi:hypothetical protein